MSAVAAGALVAAPAGAAQNRNEQRFRKLAPATRRQFKGLTALGQQSLGEMARASSAENLEGLVREILSTDSLAVGSREVGPDGRAAIHRFVLGRIESLAPRGVEYLGSLRGVAAAPVSVDRRLDPARRERPSAITVGEWSWKVTPLWPNGAMPSICPEGGLEGPLIYVGRAEWEDLRGLELEGSVALMLFEGGRHFERLFSLGCLAVVVVEDDHVKRAKAERLYCNTPVPFPRFYADGRTGAELRRLAARKRYVPAGNGGGREIVTGERCRLEGGNVYENRPYESIFAYLPPNEPAVYTVQAGDLVERIAADYGVSAADLVEANRIEGAALDAGQELLIPGRTDTYKVRPRDLLDRVAAEAGVRVEEVEKANAGLDLAGASLREGLRVTIPNIDESLVVLAPIDSASVAPDAPHGARAASNLAVALATMEHLAMSESISRRKGIVFGFIDAETLGGLTSRTFAETVLFADGKLRSRAVEARSLGPVYTFVSVALLAVAGAVITAGALRFARRRRADDAGRGGAVQSGGAGLARAGLALASASAALVGFAFFAYLAVTAEEKTQSAEVALRIARYRAASEWLRLADGAPLEDEVARWFGEEWLYTRVEERRVAAAEERIRVIHELEKEAEPAARDALDLKKRGIEDQIERLVRLRRGCLERSSLSWAERVRSFRAMLLVSREKWPPGEFDVTPASLRARLDAELAEEVERNSVAAGNTELVRKVRARLRPGGESRPVVGWFFDFSPGSPSAGIKPKGENAFRGDPPATGTAGEFERRFADVVAYASVIGGWSEEWTFLTEQDKAEHAVVPGPAASCYADFWAASDVALLPLGTLNDPLDLVDTPHDTVDRVDFRNLAVQARNAMLLVKTGLESPVDSLAPAKLKKPRFGRVVGRTVRFNIRSGIDAQDPVPYAYVYYPGVKKKEDGNFAFNTSAHAGVRRGVVRVSLLNGSYVMPVEDVRFKDAKNVIYAYHLDRRTGLFDMAVDEGRIGTQKKSPEFRLTSGQDSEKDLVMTSVWPLAFFPGPDPMDYEQIGGGKQHVKILDAVIKGEPQHYAFDNPSTEYGESDIDANIVYMPPDRPARIQAQKNITYKMLLTGPLTEEFPEGAGHRVGPRPGGGRNVALTLTPLVIAREMQALARERHVLYKSYGITDQSVARSLARSAEKIDEAASAVERRDWQVANGSAREAWGMLVKCFPRILALGREAVFSAVALMILLVPVSAFLERLLPEVVLPRKGIVARLLGTAVIFIVGVTFLNYFHPAFRISVSPPIVMVAFAMILMSVVVLVLSYQRFEILVRRARARMGEVESEEIGLVSSLATALSLGVSNLRKRPSRTYLTIFTVTALTFSIVTFVSVKGRDELYMRTVSLDTDVEGEQVKPERPRYRGVLFRSFYWLGLDSGFVSAIRSEFGTRFEVTTRSDYIEKEGGNNADREGVNQVDVRYGRKTFTATAVMAFEPNEVRFSGLDRAVTGGSWFRAVDPAGGAGEDRHTIILPDVAAEALGITEEMIVDAGGRRRPEAELPSVLMMNRRWCVIGILDTEKADRMRDVNGKSLAMVDYLRSAFSRGGGADQGLLVNEPASYHLGWKRLVIVPAAAATDVRAKPRSVAIRFGAPPAGKAPRGAEEEGSARAELERRARELYDDAALRLNRSMFGSRSPDSDDLALITTQKRRSVGGLAKIIVPVILCVLIVLNTTLANVEERRGEVDMLGAIGLSPSQISFLLLSESLVFSFTGIVFGTFAGLFFANAAGWIGILEGLSINFTSFSSTVLAMGTGVVVLLATIIPARRVAALAAPSGMAAWELPEPGAGGKIVFELPFTLTRGNAVGMMAFFRRFLLNHTEPASPDFNCRDIALGLRSGDEQALVVETAMWLSPYDLDVAQRATMKVVPTGNEGVFGVVIALARTSGTEEAWLRTNYGFMDLVRRQFLLWRNLGRRARKVYIEEGASLFGASEPRG